MTAWAIRRCDGHCEERTEYVAAEYVAAEYAADAPPVPLRSGRRVA